MVIAQLLQTGTRMYLFMSVSVLSMWYAFRLTCQYHQSCLKLTTQGHLFLIHLLVEKPHAHSSSNSIIRLDFFFQGKYQLIHLFLFIQKPDLFMLRPKRKKNLDLAFEHIFKFALEWLFRTISQLLLQGETSLFMILENPCVYISKRVRDSVCDSSSI